MPLIRIQYCSIPLGPEARDIDSILGAARVRNARSGVSGLLGVTQGHFLQILEGPEAAVATVHASLCADPRHRIVWSARETVSRRFVLPRLPMGLLRQGEHGFRLECGTPEGCRDGIARLLSAGRRKYVRSVWQDAPGMPPAVIAAVPMETALPV